MAFTSVTDILNMWADIGVFAYVIPFLLIFAVVFAILQKTKVLGERNTAVQTIIAVAVGLLSLQFDFVSTFYSEIFPRFGIGLAIFLVVIIFISFFYHPLKNGEMPTAMKVLGWVIGIGVIIWSLTSWDFWAANWSVGWWIEEYFWPLIILGAVIGVIAAVASSGKSSTPSS